jgi:transposase
MTAVPFVPWSPKRKRGPTSPRSNRKGSFVFSSWVYRQRNLVERFFNRITHFRGIATRYDKDPLNFLAAVKLIAARIWCQR